MSARISLTMIVKSEAATLARCLALSADSPHVSRISAAPARTNG